MSTLAKKVPEAAAPTPFTHDEIQSIIEKGLLGDESAGHQIKAIMRGSPPLREFIIRVIGGAARELDETAIKLIAGKIKDGKKRWYDRGRIAALTEECDALRRELAPPGSTLLKQLLAARFVTTWLGVLVSETVTGRLGHSGSELCEAHARAGDRAQRRMTQALQALQDLDRPGIPGVSVQVNTIVAGRPEASLPTTATVIETPALPAPEQPAVAALGSATTASPSSPATTERTDMPASKEAIDSKKKKAAKQAAQTAKKTAKATKKAGKKTPIPTP